MRDEQTQIASLRLLSGVVRERAVVWRKCMEQGQGRNMALI